MDVLPISTLLVPSTVTVTLGAANAFKEELDAAHLVYSVIFPALLFVTR